MTRLAVRSLPAPLIWALLAVLVGILAATQATGVTLAVLAVTAFALLGAITPLSALGILLIVAPLRALIATESPVQLPLDVGQIALIALIGFWLVDHIAHNQALPRPRWTPLYLPLIGFIAATGITAFTALSLSAWLSEWLKWVQVLLLVVICLDLGAWEWLIFALVLAGAANALIGIYEYFGGSGALHLLIDGVHFRAFGTFGQPNPFGGFMGLLAPVALMATLGYSYRLWRRWRANLTLTFTTIAAPIFYLSAAVLLCLGIYFSWSRGSWLGFAIALGAMLFALPRKWWYGASVAAALAAMIVLLWISGVLPASVIARVQSATDEIVAVSDVRGVDITTANYANVERLAHWQAALNMGRANFWFGVGFGNFETAYPQYNLLNWQLALGHAHNYYLNVFAEAGMIGLVSYLGLWISVIAVTWRARRHPDPLARLIVVGLLGTWTYLAVHSLTDNLYVNNLFLHLGVLLGVLAVLNNIECVRME